MSLRAWILAGAVAVAPLALAACASDTGAPASSASAKPGEVVGMRRLTVLLVLLALVGALLPRIRQLDDDPQITSSHDSAASAQHNH